MGAGIAITAVTSGNPVVLIDRSENALSRAEKRLDNYLARAVDKGRMAPEAAGLTRMLMRCDTNLAAAADAHLVIEAVFEKLEVKTGLLTRLEPLLTTDCLIATNTSCLRVSDIANALTRPERFFGLHYFSPAEVNRLVEVVSGEATAPEVIDRVRPFLERTGKIALACRDQSGFAVNRYFCPYVNEAVRCMEDGLGTPCQIDDIAKKTFGLPLGPFATTNIVGASVMLHALKNLSHLGPFYAPSDSLQSLAERNATWTFCADAVPLTDTDAEKIAERLLAAFFLPLSELLDEGVATPEDVDLGARHALRLDTSPAAEWLSLSPNAQNLRIRPMMKFQKIQRKDIT